MKVIGLTFKKKIYFQFEIKKNGIVKTYLQRRKKFVTNTTTCWRLKEIFCKWVKLHVLVVDIHVPVV